MASEAPYDPYIPAGGQGGAQPASNQRTAALQARTLAELNAVNCHRFIVEMMGSYPISTRHPHPLVGLKADMFISQQIDDTVGVMRENINKVSQRGERLDSLQDKTDNLAVSAQGFRRGANRVRKQMWWKDMKMRMCLIVGIIVLLIVIIVPAVVATR
ncbi:hypothetical protein AYO20_10263 [Fonsecaea nubica]|uniref:V-SNARE coiled-coil homology domain-containing protein n=1 Tax=Fonsecaea nubica TaxID=856822 RepID=A0A178C9C4_9EURO|nr:hypothetical protein AYO20_10263 [Fonsecaea nubica]OAL25994.1 hypothetical protein AYO20_10263 [Fonsecaea nubica]